MSYDDKNITINGLTDSERILEKRGTLESIIESIEAGRFRLFKVNARVYRQVVKKVIYENYFLPLEKTTIVLKNGETKEAKTERKIDYSEFLAACKRCR